jgi:hypothetical protein
MDEQRHVVDRLQHAAQDERRRHRASGEERAGDRRAERRSEAARHGGEARRRRPLGRGHDRHHVGAARRHVHLREQAAHEEQPERDFQRGCQRRRDQAEIGRQVREHHRVDEADAARERRGRELRHRAQEPGPEEERARGGEQELEALEEPQSKERVDDQATGERIDAEEAGELPYRGARGSERRGRHNRSDHLIQRSFGGL